VTPPTASAAPAGDGSRTARVLADVALAGMGTFVVIVALMHLVRADVDPADRAISEYARGDLGWLMTVAWFANGAAVLALAAGLRRSLARVARSGAATRLLDVAGVCLLVSGVFVTDVPAGGGPSGATVPGQLHDLAGLVGYLAFLLAALILQGAFGQDPRWQSMAQPTSWFARGLLGLFVARVGVVLVRLPGSAGLVQRFLWVILLGWLFWVAWHLWEIEQPAGADAARAQSVAP
jgi:hypothetical protein